MHPKYSQPIVQLRAFPMEQELLGGLDATRPSRRIGGAVTINLSAQALPFSRPDTAQTALSNVDKLCRR
jgi:hypothetical protein